MNWLLCTRCVSNPLAGHTEALYLASGSPTLGMSTELMQRPSTADRVPDSCCGEKEQPAVIGN